MESAICQEGASGAVVSSRVHRPDRWVLAKVLNRLRVNSVVFNKDDLLAVASNDGVHVLNYRTEREVRAFYNHAWRFFSVAFSPDQTMLAAGCDDQRIYLFDHCTGEQKGVLFGGIVSIIESLSFSPDGTMLAAGSVLGNIHLWDPCTGGEIRKWKQVDSLLNRVAFSPKGILASGSSQGLIYLLDPRSDREIGVLSRHRDPVCSVAFNKDEKLASGSYDKTVCLWDIGTQSKMLELLGHKSEVVSIAFSSDDATLATGSHDGTSRIWDHHTGENRK